MNTELDKWGPTKQDPGLKEELMTEIGNQMFNEAGPDFQALQALPGLLLVDDADKVGLVEKFLKMIEDGIMNVLTSDEAGLSRDME
jgi:hypothetical protein